MKFIPQADETISLELTEQERMKCANLIADAALSLDWLKTTSVAKTDEINDQVKALHDLAYIFAGDRSLEIYAPEEDSESDEEHALRLA